jgi:flagellar protein FlgJ
MRRSGNEQSPETLRFVAKQFEALFLQMMLKSARDANLDEGGMFDSEQTQFYQDLHDKQLAIELSQGSGVGIADMLVKQLGQAQASAATPAKPGAAAGRGLAEYISAARRLGAQDAPAVTSTGEGGDVAAGADASLPGTPAEFVRQMWPLAQKAAEQLHVSPQVLLAQAALETGWGRAVSRHADGRSSHNLFNIKADTRWSGDAVQVSTLENRAGQAVREQARFRAYDSFAHSFDDYVNFLRGSPRYQQALAARTDAARYAQELQAAGYATDPNYANKIMGIVEGEPFKQAVAELKLS